MINYIKKMTNNELYISIDHKIVILDCTFQKYVNQLLFQKLTNLQSREQTTKRTLGFQAKIPVFIDKSTLLMCIKSYRLEESLYINYFAITSYSIKKDYIVITFVNEHCMKLNQKHSYIKQLEKCRKILDYLN